MRVGVIDSDYRGELCVVLFNSGNEEFIVKMGDKIVQLIFETIKTPVIKETNELKGTERGDKGYGNTGISVGSTKTSRLRAQIQFRNQSINESKTRDQRTD